MRWNFLSIPKLQRFHYWSLEINKQFHPTFYSGCNYWSMLGLKLISVNRKDTWWLMSGGTWIILNSWKICFVQFVFRFSWTIVWGCVCWHLKIPYLLLFHFICNAYSLSDTLCHRAQNFGLQCIQSTVLSVCALLYFDLVRAAVVLSSIYLGAPSLSVCNHTIAPVPEK